MTEANHRMLFEQVKIGPKTAKNRFYQVPHCHGMGHRWPRTMAEMRGVKAEGGWGVVCTEECSVHPSSDLTPWPLVRLWDDTDLPDHELMVNKVHEHGALAGNQLVHNGQLVSNYLSRIPPMSASPAPTDSGKSIQARAMDKEDIRELSARRGEWDDNGIKSVTRIGDCFAPATIAVAVYSGHEFARYLEVPVDKDALFRRENDFDTRRVWQC